MSGLFFGSVLFGNLADRCGRRIALMAAVFMASTFQLLGAFMPEYYSYTASRFFAAMGKSKGVIFTILVSTGPNLSNSDYILKV